MFALRAAATVLGVVLLLCAVIALWFWGVWRGANTVQPLLWQPLHSVDAGGGTDGSIDAGGGTDGSIDAGGGTDGSIDRARARAGPAVAQLLASSPREVSLPPGAASRVAPLLSRLVHRIMAVGLRRSGSGGSGGDVPCFAGTSVPRRVVLTYHAPTRAALTPELQRIVHTWETDPAEPDVRVHYYDDAASRAFLVAHYPPCVVKAWDALVPGAFKADLFRYCELFVAGGVYADIKCTREQPYSVLLGGAGSRGVVTVDYDWGLWNGFFAAVPGAPWVGLAICRAVELVQARAYGATPLDITGPGCMGRAFREWLGLSPARMACGILWQPAVRKALWRADGLHMLTNKKGQELDDAAGNRCVTLTAPQYRAKQQWTWTMTYTCAWLLGCAYRDRLA